VFTLKKSFKLMNDRNESDYNYKQEHSLFNFAA